MSVVAGFLKFEPAVAKTNTNECNACIDEARFY
jgi:hypothetical protein